MDAEAAALLDLSFLTLAERRAIAEVLRRDAQLRRRDEGRVRRLRKSVSDPARLKSLTGDWFCDVRARRHQQPLGSELVRASIRRRRPRGTQGTGTARGRPRAQPREVLLCPGAGGTELEAIGEPWAEDREDEDSAAETEDSLSREEVLGAAEVQPCDVSPPAAALEVTPLSQSLREPDIPPGQQDIPLQPGNRRDGSPLGPSSAEEEEEEPSHALSTPSAGQVGWPTSPSRVSPQDVPGSQLSASSSVSSLSSSTLSSSLVSLYSEGELGRVAVRGGVQVALRYEPAAKELHVHVLRCRQLAEARRQRSDPYIKTYLLPDKSSHGKRKTSVRKRSLDPVFNETLKYKLEKTDLQGRTLNLSVWHHDSLGRNLFLGEVEIALGAWDWANTRPEWFDLQPRTPVSPGDLASHGHLNLALKFIPAGSEGAGLPPTGELHIWVKDARSLAPLRRGTVDAFVQCYVLPDDSKASRQKTRVVKRSLNPLFNHTMVYDGFQAKDLAEACAEVTLWHREAFAKRPLGGIRLSLGTGSSYGLPVPWMDSTAEERGVWGRVLAQPGRWLEALLPLRSDLAPRA
ncbi:synaptotagmin-like protein 1 [Nothoprocta perdicaria]|uniref:synaptotagmin-like protein 1 n=1 Tax=Nothoprocta perdicaria TaxID=30464 RepID=UPI000E1C000D|nr:synaptotagmin-like protein 1 [Nothoprocta perdicaria]